MKRISLFLALVLVFSITLVSQAAWVDGVYEAWADATPNGTQSAKIFIEGGKIVAVTLREWTDKFVEKNFSTYPWPQAGEAARTLGVQFVKNQGAKADIITGATHSCEGYIQAMERALVKASDSKATNRYFDGIFLGRSEVSDFGQYYKVVWVTLKDDQVVDYKVQRVLPDHTIQDPSPEACGGWPLDLARENYKEKALTAEPGYVDIISGATLLAIQSNHAVRDALEYARIK